MLPFAEHGKCSLVLLGTRSATARGFQQQSWRAVPFDVRSTLPAPLDFSRLEKQVFLVIGIRRLRFCRAEPNYRLPELSQPSPIAVVPLVALPPPCPCLHREQFRRSKKAILLGVPTTRQQTDATCVLLRRRMPNTRFAKLLRELGCSRQSCQSEPGGDTVVSRGVPVLSQDAQYILCAAVLISQPHQMRVCHTLRRTIVVPCVSVREDDPCLFVIVSVCLFVCLFWLVGWLFWFVHVCLFVPLFVLVCVCLC